MLVFLAILASINPKEMVLSLMSYLPLECIRRDGHIQPRAGALNTARVREYAKAMREGAKFPPVIVFQEGQKYWLADGFHRCAAAAAAERTEIEAEIRPGTQRDAILYAVGANAAHGLRRTNVDKRRSVLTLLQDSVWGQWSDHKIAQATHTTQPFVSKLRRQSTEGNAGTVRKGTGLRPPLQRLERTWKELDASEKQRWLKEHQSEIELLQGSETSPSRVQKRRVVRAR